MYLSFIDNPEISDTFVFVVIFAKYVERFFPSEEKDWFTYSCAFISCFKTLLTSEIAFFVASSFVVPEPQATINLSALYPS